MSTPVEQIKQRLGIAEVVSEYIKLEPAGINFRAKCPFHNEKTPSFFVSPTRGSFYCFGCHQGGDIFTFVQNIEGIEFKPALKLLADRAGVTLTETNWPADTDKDKVLACLAAAAGYYQRELKTQNSAYQYLIDRGLTKTSITEWQLGWAPAKWQAVVTELKTQGFTENIIIKSGLAAQAKSGRAFDRFRSRIMFPIFDATGQVVGFSGRIHNVDEANVAKYINSPQTITYDKSTVLYGLNRAKAEIRRQKQAVLVEGQMDLILSHQAGLTEAVAVSGTALSANHITTLTRLAETLILAFDADGAGFRAAKRAVALALNQGVEVKLIRLPADQDPADIITKDPAAWPKLIQTAESVIDFFMTTLAAQAADSRHLAKLWRADVYPYIKALAHPTDQAHFIQVAASRLNVPESTVWEEVKQVSIDDLVAEQPTSFKGKNQTPADRHTVLINRLLGLKWWLKSQTDRAADSQFLDNSLNKAGLTKIIDDQGEQITADQQTGLLMKTELTYQASSSDELQQEITELVSAWRQEQLKTELLQTMTKLKQAEKTGDAKLVDKYIKKCQDITQALNH